MNPYEILGVAENADDASIRSAYLTLVRRHPPERYPEKFEKINEAYQTLKDEKSRLRHYLFNIEPGIDSPFGALLSLFFSEEGKKPPGFERMKAYLRNCAMK